MRLFRRPKAADPVLAPGVPPLRPDPALVSQLKGDQRAICRYRRAAEAAVAEADRIEGRV